jgi:hypothetical protein
MTPRAVLPAVAVAVLFAAPPAATGAHMSRCAAREQQPVKPVAGGSARLVVGGATGLLLCRYRGLNPAATALRLRSSRLITDRAEIASIAFALNHLPRETAVFHCPMDDGSAILATFSYPRGAEIVIRIGLRGCSTVSGTYLPVRTVASPGGDRLVARLERLVR